MSNLRKKSFFNFCACSGKNNTDTEAEKKPSDTPSAIKNDKDLKEALSVTVDANKLSVAQDDVQERIATRSPIY